jgi:uncharacterized protein (DUF2252 family)
VRPSLHRIGVRAELLRKEREDRARPRSTAGGGVIEPSACNVSDLGRSAIDVIRKRGESTVTGSFFSMSGKIARVEVQAAHSHSRISVEPPPAVSERAASGRAARSECPRSSHSALPIADDRDPIGLLEAQDATRVPELVPIRYGRMSVSPFAFFRGAATVMAHDLGSGARTPLRTQLCGDAHLMNFGGFASPERDLVFDLNDFDETLPGPFEWDIKRLAASVEIAGRERAFKKSDRTNAVLGSISAYRGAMTQFAAIGNLGVWYARLDVAAILGQLQAAHDRKLAKSLRRTAAKAESNDSMRALSTLTREVDGQPRIVSEPPLIVPLGEMPGGDAEAVISAVLRSYRRSLADDRRVLLDRFRRVDIARKAVGVGSVGAQCWIALMLGRDDGDPLFLQLKEAEASVLEPLLAGSEFATHGQRVVEGQRLMQAASDIFLGWVHTEPESDNRTPDLYVRQLRDWKVSVDARTILPHGLDVYGAACGWTLARAHARSGDAVAIASYLGSSDRFDRAIAEFARGYADLNEKDHRALVDAIAHGRVSAVDGV